MLEFDRDPYSILDFAREVKEYYENESALINAAIQAVEGYLSELDDKSQSLGEVFLQKAQTIRSGLDSYNDLAQKMEKKANEVIELQNSVRF
ncbi:MAG: hypothetical protein ACI4I3_01930 [Acutalibacteraceae bacterium]